MKREIPLLTGVNPPKKIARGAQKGEKPVTLSTGATPPPLCFDWGLKKGGGGGGGSASRDPKSQNFRLRRSKNFASGGRFSPLKLHKWDKNT